MNDPSNGILIDAGNHLVGHNAYTSQLRDLFARGKALGKWDSDIILDITTEARLHFENGGAGANFIFTKW